MAANALPLLFSLSVSANTRPTVSPLTMPPDGFRLHIANRERHLLKWCLFAIGNRPERIRPFAILYGHDPFRSANSASIA